MRRTPIILLAFIFFYTPASFAVEYPLIDLSSDRVVAGTTLALTVNAGSIRSDLTLHFGDQKGVVFNPPGAGIDRQIGLLAVPFKTAPGAHELKISWRQSGAAGQRLIPFNVIRGDYSSERLKVDPGRVNPSEKNRRRAAREHAEVRRIYATGDRRPKWQAPFERPLGSPITSPFGNRRLFNGELVSYHSGVDFRAATGTPVKAANRGVVRLAKNLFYAGNTLLIDHGAGIFTIYAHLSRMDVSPGQSVDRGEQIGLTGRSGRVSGPHLHWGVKLNGQNVAPLQFIELVSNLTFH